MKKMKYAHGKFFLLICIMIIGLQVSHAQTPSISPVGDESDFAGSQVCVDIPLINTGPPGFAPYIQLIVPVGLTFDSATLFGSGATVTNIGPFPTAPGNMLTDTIINAPVTGPEDYELILIQPPIGSLVDGAPPLDMEVCFTIDIDAPIGAPLDVTAIPVYEFGDTATGDNGPIVGSGESFNITPILVLFDKENNAPEDERPPSNTSTGTWPVTYTLTADIAPGATIDNVVFTDVLPTDFVIDPASIMITGGTGCVAVAPDITVECTSATGTTADDDVVITYSGSFTDVLDEAVCDSRSEINNASLDGEFDGNAIPQETDTDTIQLLHLPIQKNASPNVVAPGDTVTYTLNLQVSDFATANNLVVTDILPDGVTFTGTISVVIGGVPLAVVPTVSNDTPTNGQTTVAYDLTAAAGNIASGTAIQIVYNSEVDALYFNGEPLLASDPLTNTVTAMFGLTDGAAACSNGSSDTIVVEPVDIEKSIITTGPYTPGDTVTYRLTMSIPSGDTQDIVFTDFFPLPAFDVNDINLAFPGPDISLSLLDTLGLTPDSISIDGATNSLVIEWPDITTTSPQTLSVDINVRITTDPFADGLNLSNLLQVDSANTPGATATNVTPVNIEIGAPDLAIAKGVVAADQGTISPPVGTLPEDGNVAGVDAGDSITFQLTIENIGGAAAFDVFVDDPAVAGLTNCTLVSVEDGTGAALATSPAPALDPGFTITTPLTANDDNPMGGGAPYGADTAIVTYTCDIDSDVTPGQLIENTASVIWASETGGVTFPPVDDTAETVINEPGIVKSRIDTAPDPDGDDGTVTIGETIQYQVVITIPEGESLSTTLTDLLDNGLVFQSFDNIFASPGLSTDHAGGFPGVLADATTLGTRNGSFPFDNITNTDTDNTTAETITITYTVLVTDVTANVENRARNNSATFNYNGESVTASTNNVRIREPVVTITKLVNPTTADAGDTVTYTVVLSNTGTSDAFNVEMIDLLSDPNLTLVTTPTGTVTTTQGTITTGNTAGDTTVVVDVGTIPFSPLAAITVTFDVLIGNGVTSGQVLANTASVTSESLPVGGREYGPTDDDAEVTIAALVATKTVLPATSSEQTGGTSGQGDTGLVDLTIGEEVTFQITATLAEGVSPSVIITDTLPGGATGLMEVVSSTVVSVGGNLTPTNSVLTGTIGPANVVVFDFGSVTNVPDGVSDTNDQIVVQVTAVVVNDPVNSGLEVLTNNVMIQFDTGLSVSGSANVEVVEPRLGIDKSSPTTTADAGDTITYTIVITNDGTTNSSANAYDVAFTDMIPAGLTFAGNLSLDSGLAPDAATLIESSGIISAFWTNFTLGSSATISFDVTVDGTVVPEQNITNTANVAWGSLPGADANEREGTANEPHDVMISAPGLNKIVFDSSETTTGTTVNGPEDDIAIGESVTYRFTLTLPEGTSPNAMAIDQLPTVSTIMNATGASIVSTGANISISGSTTAVLSDSDADTYDDLVTWNLGDVVNTPDGVSNADDQITFEVIAVLVDQAVNQSGLNDVINTATFTSGTTSIEDTALIDVVEPDVEVTKVTIPASITADAGDMITYRITLDHTTSSNSDAFNFTITDILPDPGTSWINDSTVISTCAGIVTDSSADPSIVFTVPALALTTDSCTIDYQVTVDVGVNPNESYQNTVTASWTSTSVIGSETRTDSDMASSSFVTPDPSIIKTALSANTSLTDTGDNVGDMLIPDMAIGEMIDFNITAIFPEGTTTNAVIVDQLPLVASGGVLEMVSANVNTIGSNISTSLAGVAVIVNTDADAFDDQATMDFGTVTNTPDGVVDANDEINITVTARVVDVVENANLDVLTNNVTFTFGAGTVLGDTADVEVVTPLLGLAKAMGPMVDNVVPITLTFSNTGNAPAYDITIEDVLDTNIWDVSTISATSIPTGFVFSDIAGPGATEHTVSISSDPLGSTPTTSIEPAEVIVFTFNVTLRDDVTLPATIPNTATVTEASTLPGADPTERDLPEVDGSTILEIPIIDSTKTAAIVTDSNVSGGISPGEQILYTIIINNTGDGAATNVMLSDAPDVNTLLDVGSVTTSTGSVVTGNTLGDTIVEVSIPNLAASSSVTITYTVTVNDPIAAGVTSLTNQGLIESDELPDSTTDDPDTGTDDDPTIVPVDGAPDLAISKDDGGTTAVAGGVVAYTITYSNIGDQNDTGVIITETVPANSTFNPGSSTGVWTCLPNNNAGSTCTQSIGNVNAGDPPASTTFAVTIDNPLAAGITQLSNTVSIAGDGPDGDSSNNNGSDTTPITSTPDLQVTKTDSGVTAVPGGVVTYVINYINVGSQDATGVVVTETVPANSTFNATASTIGWLCTPDNNPGSTCTFTVGNVAGNNGSGNVNFAIQIDDPLAAGVSQIDNTVTIADDGSNGADPTPDDNSGGDSTPVDAAPDLSITKTDNNVIADAGDTVPYTIAYDNIGNQNATGVVITETVPANSTFNAAASTIGWTCLPNVNAGSLCTIAIGNVNVSGGGSVIFAINIDNPLPDSVLAIVNNVSIADDGANGIDPDPDNNTGGDNTPVTAVPDLTITKDDGGITATVGASINYLINYSNIGTQQATGIVLTETVPAHTVFNAAASTVGWACTPTVNAGSTCTLSVPDLNGGGDSATANFVVDVLSTLPAGVEFITNTIGISDDGNNGPDADPNNNSDNDDTPVTAAPDLQISKDDGGATSTPGSTVVYTLTYSNVGDQDATGVVITETVPANSTFNAAASTAGWVCIPDNSAGNTCTLTIGGVTAGAAAASVTYAITVDTPLPSGVTEIANSVSIADDGNNGIDPTPDDNGDSDTTPIDATPDLVVTKTDSGVSADAGDTIVYVITYNNIGDQNATGVVITETVPANSTFNAGASDIGWSCTPDANAGSTCTLAIGAVAVNTAGTASFAVTVDNPLPTNVKAIINTVTIADDGNNGVDPDPDNNTGGDNTPLGSVPDLTISKDDQGVTATAGGTIVYTIDYANVGTQQATGVVITETVPLHTTFNATSSTLGWSCTPDNTAGSSCTLSVPDLNGGGDSGSVMFAVDVDATLPAGVDEIDNTVSIADDGDNGADADPNNNADNDNTPVDAAPDLSLLKVDQSNNANAGGTIIYDLTYQNLGPQDATGVVITETVPDHTTFDATSSSTGWSCTPDNTAGSTCIFNIGALNVSDGAATVQFAVTVDNPLPAGVDQILNTASIADDGTNGDDPDDSNNTDPEDTNIGAFPDLTITKTDGDISAGPGQTIVYTLDYSNIGDQNATGVTITETVPANTTYNDTASSVSWSCTPDNTAGSTCTFLVGALDAGDSGSVTYAVDVDDPLAIGVNLVVNNVSIGDDGTNGDDANPDNNDATDDTSLQLEPPVGLKIGEFDADNPRLIHWTFWWFNPNNDRDLPVFIFDDIPVNTVYAGNESCQATGSSTCTQPIFNSSLNRLELTAILAEDQGAAPDSTPDQLNNEIVIRFDTLVTGVGTQSVENQAMANWDQDNDGDPNNDADDGQAPIPTDDPVSIDIGDPTRLGVALSIPTLGLPAIVILIMIIGLVVRRKVRF